jgi:hypothetical protein
MVLEIPDRKASPRYPPADRRMRSTVSASSYLSNGRTDAITSIAQEQRRSASCVWPLLAMQAKTYSARAVVG